MQVQDVIEQAVEHTLADHRETVDAWIEGTPKTWGFLAGQVVLACRRSLGRSLTEAERRLVWDRLWRQLQTERRRRLT